MKPASEGNRNGMKLHCQVPDCCVFVLCSSHSAFRNGFWEKFFCLSFCVDVLYLKICATNEVNDKKIFASFSSVYAYIIF